MPELKYAWVDQLMVDFPHLKFMLNGGIQYADLVAGQHRQYAGVMLGRAVYNDPIGLNLATLSWSAEACMAYRLKVGRHYLNVLAQLGYTTINRRSVMPLVLLCKAFKGSRQMRAELVELGGKSCALDALALRLGEGFVG